MNDARRSKQERMKQARKKNAELYFEYCFKQSLNNDILKESLIELMKYIFFLRHQIPIPYKLLLTEYQMYLKGQEKKRTLPNTYQIKMKKFIEGSVQLFRDLDEVFSNRFPAKIILMFGSTLVSPKEVIFISMDFNHCSSVATNVTSFEKQINISQVASKKLMKFFITSEKIKEFATIPQCNIFLFLAFQEPEEKIESLSFVSKLRFQYPKRGTKHQISLSCCLDKQEHVEEIKVAVSSDDGLMEQMENCSISGDKEKDYHWYLSLQKLHGFREHKKLNDTWI